MQNMDPSGADCYFYYYSTCTKGDFCPFRHEPSALGSETECTLWRRGCCTRDVCSFRHMEISKKRSAIACYWETQPGGCQKQHCVFKHNKPRNEFGTIVTNENRSFIPEEMQTPIDMNTQSPLIQPILINPHDEESDQDSTAGTPEKNTRQFVTSSSSSSETMLDVHHVPTLQLSSTDSHNVKTRLGNRGNHVQQRLGNTPQHTSSLLQRLGVPIVKENIHNRLGRVNKTSPDGTEQSVQNMSTQGTKKIAEKNSAVEIRVKTLEEIRKEKALKTRGQKSVSPIRTSNDQMDSISSNEPRKPLKRVRELYKPPVKDKQIDSVGEVPAKKSKVQPSVTKDPKSIHIKTLEEIRQEKRLKQDAINSQENKKPTRNIGGDGGDGDTHVEKQTSTKLESIHIKTLDEIRQEKDRTDNSAHIKSHGEIQSKKQSGDADVKTVKKAGRSLSSIHIKSLDEIRSEKAVKKTDHSGVRNESPIVLTSDAKNKVNRQDSTTSSQSEKGLTTPPVITQKRRLKIKKKTDDVPPSVNTPQGPQAEGHEKVTETVSSANNPVKRTSDSRLSKDDSILDDDIDILLGESEDVSESKNDDDLLQEIEDMLT